MFHIFLKKYAVVVALTLTYCYTRKHLFAPSAVWNELLCTNHFKY